MSSDSKQESSPRASAKPARLKSLSPPIHRLLSKLRTRIRWIVLFEGLALALVWMVSTFWVALALDYLPVRFGFSELSRPARIVLLLMAALIIGYVLYRLVFRRVFVSMKDRSMAMLIERRYPQFNDSLLTTVNRATTKVSDVPVDESMLERTRVDAESLVGEVKLETVASAKPLNRSLVVAGLCLLSVVGFALVQPGAMKLACQRLYLLEQSPWPRQCKLEMVGIKVKRENPVEGIVELGQTIVPVDGKFKIAKGATLTLMIRAESESGAKKRELPGTCSLIYSTEGERGTQPFKKIGAPRDGFQLYSLDGQPFRGILSKISFSVLGGDHRLGPFEVEVVDEPDVFATKLDCRFPEYIVDEESLRWTDRTIDWTGQAKLPIGTAITLRASANKPLKKVYVFDRAAGSMTALPADEQDFAFEIPAIQDAVNLQFYLCDQDGLVVETPHSVNIEPIEDQPPVVDVRIKGIGTAVTPDVRIPFSGTVKDDYGLKESWVEIEVAETETLTVPVSVDSEGVVESEIDFRKRKQQDGKQFDLPVGEDNVVSLVVKSSDKYDLSESENLGIGDKYVLDIVDGNQLIRILERLEVDQRRRLEQIYEEVGDTRNYLLRAKSLEAKQNSGVVEPGDRLDVVEPGEEDDSNGIRRQEMQLLFAQRALIQIDKSTQEILGSAEAFDNIRLQLINNRIDSEDRKTRFSEQIIAPLRLIGRESMRQLRERAVELELSLRNLQLAPNDDQLNGATDELAHVAIEGTDQVLKELNAVLDVLIKYETQNELLEIVRQMIKAQKELQARTKKERQRKAFEGLLD